MFDSMLYGMIHMDKMSLLCMVNKRNY